MPDEQRGKRPRQKGDEDGGGSRPSRGLLIWLILIGGVILIVSLVPDRVSSRGRDRGTVYFNDIVQGVRRGQFESLVVHNETTLYVVTREGSSTSQFPKDEFKITISPHVIEALQTAVDTWNKENPDEPVQLGFKGTSTLLQNLLGMLPWILMLFLIYYMFIRQIRGDRGSRWPAAWGGGPADRRLALVSGDPSPRTIWSSGRATGVQPCFSGNRSCATLPLRSEACFG